MIVNIASVVGTRTGVVGATGDGASKGGVVALTKGLAVELGGKGVRVNVIVPGYVDTEMLTPGEREDAVGRTPLGRVGTVEEVADVAEFLVKCGFVNGAEVVVDGGLSCT